MGRETQGLVEASQGEVMDLSLGQDWAAEPEVGVDRGQRERSWGQNLVVSIFLFVFVFLYRL